MVACSRLATMLDADMLARHHTTISAAGTPFSELPNKTGPVVAWELGGRYLLRYLLSHQVTLFARGIRGISSDFLNAQHYVTPTPFSPEETVSWLALPAPDQPRPYVILLKPEAITKRILGPRWVRVGGGIEYLLPDGFDSTAIVNIGVAPNTQWPLLVT